MGWHVYIIQSEYDSSYYKRYSEHPLLRLREHNNGKGFYTASKTPWKLVYVEEMPSKTSALIREKNLKKATIDRITGLSQSSKKHRYTISNGSMMFKMPPP